MLTLFLQPDSKGEEGDVRDLIVVRSNIQWEIGLSLKHNHFAVKHSRLARTWILVVNGSTYPVLRSIGVKLNRFSTILKSKIERNILETPS